MVGQSVDMRVWGKIWLGYSAGVMGSGGEWEEQVRGHGLSTRRLSGLSTAQGRLDPLERDTQKSAPRSGLGFSMAD